MTDVDTHVSIPAQATPSDPTDLAGAYLEAWTAHDAAAVAAIVSGTYSDPTLPGPVRGSDLAGYVDALAAAFPDLSFEMLGEPVVAGDRMFLHWRMRGTNDGAPLPGAPMATGGTIDLPGVDVITVADGRIVDVVGYFDQKTFVEQLGLQAHLTPQDEWPVAYGSSLRVDIDRREVPGAMTFTWIDLDDSEAGELVERSQQVVMALASEPGFLGFGATTVGPRFTTIAMWTSPQAAEAAIARNTPHSSAMQRVQREGFGSRGFTSFWQPYRINEQHVRCTACGEWPAIEAGADAVVCSCGERFEVTPYL
jgi:steroid delta-isomerase-like uncharacterized protein